MIQDTQIVQGSIQTYTCVVEKRESGNIFHLITNSNVIEY